VSRSMVADRERARHPAYARQPVLQKILPRTERIDHGGGGGLLPGRVGGHVRATDTALPRHRPEESIVGQCQISSEMNG